MTNSLNEKRIKVLEYSLGLERVASLSLAYLFDIENIEQTKSLGNKNTSISFNQKLNLLLDSKSIDQIGKEKLGIFMEVRNQFMHNFNVKSFEDVFKLLKGREIRLKKFYPTEFSDDIQLEKSFEIIIGKLYIEGLKTLIRTKGARELKIQTNASNQVHMEYFKRTPFAIDKALKLLTDDIENETFDFENKNVLIENILLLKQQILLYQIIEDEN
jgi:hypothetical protein